MHRFRNKNQGFTLIELLVVISIIGFLASMVMVAFKSGKIRASDTKRVQDIEALSKAMELYSDNNGGKYDFGSTGYLVYSSNQAPQWNVVQAALGPYIPKLPQPLETYSPYMIQAPNVGSCYGPGDGVNYAGIKASKGFLINSSTWNASLPANDGGINQYSYEIYGGDFQMFKGPDVSTNSNNCATYINQ